MVHIQKAAQTNMKAELLKDEFAKHPSVGERVKPPTCPTVVKQKLVMPQDRKQILKHVQTMFFSFFSKQAGILQVY